MSRNRTGRSPNGNSDQRGASLFTALIILVALTLLTLASLSTSLLQLRMSSNEESKAAAFQSAQASIDNIINTDYIARQPLSLDYSKQYFKIAGAIGHAQCTPNWSGGTCNTSIVTLTSPLDSASSGPNKAKIVRLTDPISTRNTKCPKAATFQIESVYDRSALGHGKSELIQGYIACDYLNAPLPPLPSSPDQN
jgi:FlaG/FlaF family flagellin (archaellin)